MTSLANKTSRTSKTRKNKKRGKRTIYCRDALPWLENHVGTLETIISSLPEMDEMSGMRFSEYETFFRHAARLCLQAVQDNGYCIFLQTDRKYHGWVDKSYWITDEAVRLGMRMIWHKIALRKPPGGVDLFRPTYSHMLCYSRKGPIGIPVSDVVERGDVAYENAFGQEAVRLVVQYVKDRGIRSVVDPFVGSGTVVAVANALGLRAVGVDLDPAQCRRARTMHISFTP